MSHPPHGLSSEEARRLLAEVGPNELNRQVPEPAWRLFVGQFRSPMVALLGGAAILSGALGELRDAGAIAAIVVLNAVVGFYQEYNAQKAVFALRSMTAPRARVVRDGRAAVIPAAEVVPGDHLLLEAGDIVAADAAVTVAHRLLVNEATLTGESLATAKSSEPSPADAPLAERHDQVFAGTVVVNGTGGATVRATGMGTEIGRIAHLLATAQTEETPLARRLDQLGRALVKLAVGVVALVALIGLLRGVAPLEVMLGAVSLAVAAVPEGLPAIVTIALALGVQRMAARNVLVRHMPAVETLGCATVICTDKTGTLTQGTMVVRRVWGEQDEVVAAAAACCDAELGLDGASGTGDPTELAILQAALVLDIHRADIEAERPRVSVHPFDSERKMMSVLRADGVLYVKGAVDRLIPLCTSGTEGAEAANAELATAGLRVLGVALGSSAHEGGLRLLGLLGIADPPRPEAVQAVAEARSAGVQTVMITGDHPVTAQAIARELGILLEGEDPAERVHARVTPEDKLNIVRSWKARGAVVAMTGDGVNDAPAIRESQVGVAMGRGGTEVTREAADIVLADDNFASIVAGIREGRAIYDNIKKALIYLLAGNAAELAVMFGASALGFPAPMLPIHLLWINLVTDGLPALALVTDPPDRDVLRRPPRATDEPILGRREWTRVLASAVIESGVVLGAFVWVAGHRSVDEARAIAFSVLVFSELFRAFAARSERRIFWEVGWRTNLQLLAVVVVSVLLQLAILGTAPGRALFRLGEIPLVDGAIALGLGLIPVTVIELSKLVRRGLA